MWDAKNNFILLHSIHLYQQQSLTFDIHWPSIVNDIQLEISSTSELLENQYEYLLKNVHRQKDSKSLYLTLKHIYLHGLCQTIEDELKFTLEAVYELIRHVRAKRIDINDVEQLIMDRSFSYSSDEQKANKERLFSRLNRLRDYCRNWSSNPLLQHHHPLEHSNINGSSVVVHKRSNNEEMETVSESEDESSRVNKPNELMNIDNHSLISNSNDQEKSSLTPRGTQSVILVDENHDNKRSSSSHARSQSPTSTDLLAVENQTLSTTRILMTTIDTDEPSCSTNDSNLRQTHTQPVISWLPLTDEQIVGNEHRETRSKLINEEDLEPISSTDSDSIETQWQTSSNKKASRSSSSHHLHQPDQSSSK